MASDAEQSVQKLDSHGGQQLMDGYHIRTMLHVQVRRFDSVCAAAVCVQAATCTARRRGWANRTTWAGLQRTGTRCDGRTTNAQQMWCVSFDKHSVDMLHSYHDQRTSLILPLHRLLIRVVLSMMSCCFSNDSFVSFGWSWQITAYFSKRHVIIELHWV